jgi:hypothetical protein
LVILHPYADVWATKPYDADDRRQVFAQVPREDRLMVRDAIAQLAYPLKISVRSGPRSARVAMRAREHAL